MLLFLLTDKSGCAVPALVLPFAATAAGVASTAAAAAWCWTFTNEDAVARRLLASALAASAA